MNTHTSQVTNPLIRIRPRSSTAKFLPTTAMFPLSKYRKGRRGARAFELSGNHLAHVASLLDRNLGNTRQRSSVLTQGSHIAHGENAVDARHHQERIDRKSSGSIGRDAERLHDRRSRDACRPQDGRARNPLSSGDDALLVDLFDLRSRQNFDAELLKPSGRPSWTRIRRTSAEYDCRPRAERSTFSRDRCGESFRAA